MGHLVDKTRFLVDRKKYKNEENIFLKNYKFSKQKN